MPEAAAAVERTGIEDDCSCIIFTPDIHVGRIHSVPAFKDLHRSQHGHHVSMRSPWVMPRSIYFSEKSAIDPVTGLILSATPPNLHQLGAKFI